MDVDTNIKKKSINIDDKLKIISLIESGQSQISVAEQFQVDPSTVSKIYKQKEKWHAVGLDDKSRKIKKYRPCRSQAVECAVLKFVTQAREHRVALSGPILQSKAKTYANALGVENFKVRNSILSQQEFDFIQFNLG